MKTFLKLALALVLAAGLAAAATAGDETTLTGKVVCGKCSLKKAAECQDVLVVEGAGAGEYWITKNDVAKNFGHACKSEKAAKVTGTLSEKDGKKWVTPSAMEEVKG
jgi:hypothetical protein